MDIDATDLIRLALWAAAAIVAAGVCLPMLLAILGFTRVQFLLIAGPEATEAVGEGDPRYLDRYDRLRELGFEPLAVRVEQGWFYLWFWVRTSLPGPIFARPGRDCFASLYRLYRGDPWRLAFATILSDGTVVSTADQIEKLRIDRPGYWRRGYVTEDAADLLRLHEETVASFRVRGWTVAKPELEEYYDIYAQRTEEYLRESGTGKAAQCLQTAVILMMVGTLTAGLWLGYGNWALPFVPMGCGLIYELLMPGTIRSGADQIRRQEQAFALAKRAAMAHRMAAGEPEPGGGGGQGVISAEQRRQAAETIRSKPPPRPPPDLPLPPEP